jgi:hypothetical protein
MLVYERDLRLLVNESTTDDVPFYALSCYTLRAGFGAGQSLLSCS